MSGPIEQVYPLNLRNPDLDRHDMQSWVNYTAQMARSRLSSSGDIEFLTLLEEDPTSASSTAQSTDHNIESDGPRAQTHIYLAEIGSGQKIHITLENLRKVLGNLQVCPDFLEAVLRLPCVGRRFHCLPAIREGAENRKEFWYTIPFPNSGTTEPLGVSQMCVWADEDCVSGKKNILIMGASKEVGSKLRRFVQNQERSPSPSADIQCHLHLLRSALHKWADYHTVARFYAEFAGLDFHEHNERNADINSTMKKLHTTIAGLENLVAVIKTFSLTLTWLHEHQWQPVERESTTNMFDHRRQWMSELKDMTTTLAILSSKTESLVTEIKNTQLLVRPMLPTQAIDHLIGPRDSLSQLLNRVAIRKHETVIENGLRMQRIAENTERNGSDMAVMAEQSRDDARSMKTIAVVTMAYLPGTFVATFFSMHFLQLDPDRPNDLTFTFAKYIWLYFVVAILLTAITFLVWGLSMHRRSFFRLLSTWFGMLLTSAPGYPMANHDTQGDTGEQMQHESTRLQEEENGYEAIMAQLGHWQRGIVPEGELDEQASNERNSQFNNILRDLAAMYRQREETLQAGDRGIAEASIITRRNITNRRQREDMGNV